MKACRYYRYIAGIFAMLVTLAGCSYFPRYAETMPDSETELASVSETEENGESNYVDNIADSEAATKDSPTEEEKTENTERRYFLNSEQAYKIGEEKIDLSLEETSVYRLENGYLQEVIGEYNDYLYFVGCIEVNVSTEKYVLCRTPLTRKDGSVDIVSELEEINTENSRVYVIDDLIGDSIYIMKSVMHGDFISTLYKVRLTGEVSEVKKWESKKVPDIYSVGHYLVCNLLKEFGCELSLYDFETDKESVILTTEMKYEGDNPFGRGTGDYIMYGGGTSDKGFCFQLVHLQEEMLEDASDADIYYYDILSDKLEYVLSVDRISNLISGDDQVIFSNEYYDQPYSLVLYDVKKEAAYRIEAPDIFNGGYDLTDISKASENKYVGQAGLGKLFSFDISNYQVIRYMMVDSDSPSDDFYPIWVGGENNLVALYRNGSPKECTIINMTDWIID